MSYCRFSEGDVYLFHHVDGYIQCCACNLAPLVPTIFTKGYVNILDKCKDCGGDGCSKCWCKECEGAGCEGCMMHSNTNMDSRSAAIKHIREHISKGHDVPNDVVVRLEDEIKAVGDDVS